MKTIFLKTVSVLFIFLSVTAKSQDAKQMGALLESKKFVFIAQTAIPQGIPTVNLSSSNNFLRMHPDRMEGHLPYFGRAFSGTPYGGDAGIRFNAEPSEYELKKNKKNYEITATVQGETETYRLTLTVGFDGYSTLHVYSNKRSSISYYGNVSAAENNIENKE